MFLDMSETTMARVPLQLEVPICFLGIFHEPIAIDRSKAHCMMWRHKQSDTNVVHVTPLNFDQYRRFVYLYNVSGSISGSRGALLVPGMMITIKPGESGRSWDAHQIEIDESSRPDPYAGMFRKTDSEGEFAQPSAANFSGDMPVASSPTD